MKPIHLIALVVVFSAAQANSAELKSFDVERSWALQRIGNPAISPDGKTIIAPVSRVVSPDTQASD